MRTKALAMGAQYRTDWTGDCTLLLAVFFNAPKVRRAIAVSATVVHKVRFHWDDPESSTVPMLHCHQL